MMRKKKLTKRERKAQREAAERRRFYSSTVVRCFLCETWQLVEVPDAETWDCCCGAGGTLDGGLVETLTMPEFLIDDWTDRIVEFWTSNEPEHLGLDPVGIRHIRRSANPALLFAASAELWQHLLDDCDCWSDDQAAITAQVPDLQRVDWYVVSDVVRSGKRRGGEWSEQEPA
jgi:hypothetical protein